MAGILELDKQKEKEEERKKQLVSFFGSFGVWVLILLLLLILKLYPPEPPLPDEPGMEVMLGNEGGNNSEIVEPAPPGGTPEQQPAPVIEDQTPTEDLPNDEEVKVKKVEPKPDVQPKVNEQPKVEEPKPRKVNPNILYTDEGDGDDGTTDGTKKSGPGDKSGQSGNKDGDPNSKNPYGSGQGGADFDLGGRGKISIPIPKTQNQVEGKIVVEIVVDQTGKVIDATPGKRGTTITDPGTWELVRREALKAKFDPKADAPDRQYGTITYYFNLK